jgi:hypothetical protein
VLAVLWSVAVSGGGLLLAPRPALATLPPGYVPVPGTVPLNPAHVGAVGSQFTQDCTGLPRPPQPGEVAWHFMLPQSVQFGGGTPTNVFNTLTVTFQTAGTVTLGALSDFGPPNNAHAYVFTPTDDTLLAGDANIGRLISAPPARSNDAQFNLSHTCASPDAPTTTTTSTTTTIRSSSTTTTTTSSTSRP